MSERKILVGAFIIVVGLFLLSAPGASAQEPCECNADFDQDVDADDVTRVLEDFGRSRFNNPCPPSGPAPVPKTKQTTSYSSGDDGELQSGIDFPDPRFTDHGDGTVTDNLTALMWAKDTNLPGGSKTWQGALDYVSDMNAGINENYGYTNWKLPNLRELQSVIDYGQFDPALTLGHPFENVLFVNYWSSTTAGGITVYAWAVHIRNGTVERYLKTTDTLYVWPIRVRQ